MFDDRKKRSGKEVDGCRSDEDDQLTSSEDVCLEEEDSDEDSGCQGCGV